MKTKKPDHPDDDSAQRAAGLRREAEAALLQVGAVQNAIFNSAIFSGIATDAKGVIQIFNVGAERMLGYTAAEVINKLTPADLSDPQEVMARAQALSAEVGKPITPGFEALVYKASHGIEDIYALNYIRKDGSRFPAVVSVTAVRDAQGAIFGFLLIGTSLTAPLATAAEPARQREPLEQLVTARTKDLEAARAAALSLMQDATKLRQQAEHTAAKLAASEKVVRAAHDDLHRANAELAQASRLKDEFLANMSHELRTPLNAILGLSEALLEQVSGPLTPRQLKSITTISTSGAHLLALINDILDLSKIEAGKLELNPETLNLAEFCESCLVFVRTQAMHKHIAVAFEHDAGAARFTADPKRLKQILVNLLTNAVKFTPEGGRLGLTVTAPEGEDVVRFAVWDTGIGIAPADQGKLFKAFTQVDSGLSRTQEGTGLGLALVAKLVELHGGSVALESEPGKGSRFVVTLPQGAAPARSATTKDTTNRQGYRRALIIEDDPTAATILGDLLTELGLSSVWHQRGENSLDTALQERPDLILLDILMPNESGWVVLTRLKEHPQTRDIPVVVVSVVDEPEKSRALGAVAHFTKPVTRGQLAGFLQRPVGAGSRSAAPFAAPPCPRRHAILLAEDNEANIQTIGGYLEDKGYVLHYARNGFVAVQLARELRPSLILMDIQMPVMDGLAAMREIRANPELKQIPIVALTALAMPGDRERCLAAGATDYLSKPVILKELAELVKRLLTGHAPS